jgi:hypothetical protein
MSARKSWRLSAAPTIACASRSVAARARALLRLCLGAGVGTSLTHLEAGGLELARQRLDLVLREILLEREGLDLGRLDEAALLGALEQDACGLGFEQLLKLVLGQLVLFGLRRRTFLNLSHCTAILLT